MPEEFICPHCNKPVENDWKVCPFCQESLVKFAVHYCIKCGTGVEDSWKVCPKCGELIRGSVSGISPTASISGRPHSIPSPSSDFAAPGKNPNILLGLLSFIIPISGLMLGAIFISKPRSDDKHTGKLCFGWAVAGIVMYIFLSIVFAFAVHEYAETGVE